MKSNLHLITVVPRDDPKKIYKLNEQAIVIIWDIEGVTMCKDVLGNTWIVLDAEL